MEIPKQLKDKSLRFCRVRKGTKKPFEKDWTKKPYTYEEIKQYLGEENYGLLCGHGNLAVIDCDTKELQLAVEKMFPITFTVKTGGGGTHNYYFIPNLKKKIILEMDEKHLGEVQSYGTQVVGAGSIHPNKREYKIQLDVPIATISLEKLYEVLQPFMKEVKETEEVAKLESEVHSDIDDLNVLDIWGSSGLKKQGQEYYGSHPIHGSDGGMNFWINPLKNLWHCFRCDSGGGALSAIAVKEGIIDCSEARRGLLRGQKVRETLKIAEDKYGLKKTEIKPKEVDKYEDKIQLLWDDELQNFEAEDQEWIVDKLIPSRSVCILTGKRGTLKTFITLLMSYSISSGNDFLGEFPVKQGKVIYLDKENGIPIMKKRVRMIKQGLEIKEKQDVGFICFSQLKIDKTTDLVKLSKLIVRHEPKLLIIDTYRRGISFDENDAGAVSELFVDMLRPLVERYNVSIVLIHHNRKGGGDSPDEMDELRGSSDLANYADIILKMERKAGVVVLKQLKNRNAQEIEPIRLKVEFNEDSCVKMNYEGVYQKQSKADRCVELILAWIARDNIHHFSTGQAKAICIKGGYKDSAIKNALNEMQDTGTIERKDFGTYTVL